LSWPKGITRIRQKQYAINTVYVCNIRHHEFRLIIAVHFDGQRVYTLRFMTHAEYSRTHWKNEL